MADISQENKQEMQATAGGLDYQSLGDAFTQQYNRLVGVQEAQDAYTPQASQNARAVGDVSDRASGEAPVPIAQQGIALTDRMGQIKEGTTSSILDVLTGMVSLKQQERQAEQDLLDAAYKKEQTKALELENQQTLAQQGMIWDDEKGGPRPMNEQEELAWAQVKYQNLSDEDAVALLKDITGLNDLELGGIGKERGAYAKRMLEKIDRGDQISYRDILPQKQREQVDKKIQAIEYINDAITAIDTKGKQTGFLPNLLLKIGGPFDAVKQEQADLQTALSNVAGTSAFEDSGKQLTDTERDIVEGKINIMGKGEKQNKAILESIRRKTQAEIESLTGNLTPDLGEQGEDTIRVKEKQSGQTGTIPVSEFDPELYEKI